MARKERLSKGRVRLRALWTHFVRKAVHRADIYDSLLVGFGSVHHLDGRARLPGRDAWIYGAVTDQDLDLELT